MNRTPRALANAFALIDRNIPVFPCGEDKKPLTAHGFKDASTSVEAIRAWWACWPDALIGVPTGIRFVVIDIDLQHADALQWLEDNRRRLPITRTHSTRSGGKHYLFAPNDKVKCSAGKLGPHVDTRGHGGYIIWWPACGLVALHGGVLARVPDWIIEALNPKPVPIPTNRTFITAHSPSTASIRGALRVLADAREGERNRALFWTSCRMGEAMRAGAISENEALGLLLSVGRSVGLLDREIMSTARSGFREGLQ
jgi:Bifunctional DNA primase/polymerase, N-terminal